MGPGSRLALTFDPALERDLGGPDADAGWELEPRARVALALSRAVALGVEYYGNVGHPGALFPSGEQVHQFYPSVDLRLGEDFSMNFGLGFGVTANGERLVFKARFEIPLAEPR